MLERGAARKGEELLDAAHGGHKLGGTRGPADLPARERVRLSERRDGDGPLGHPVAGGYRDVLAVVDQGLVHLVSERDDVVAPAGPREPGELASGPHPPPGGG